MVQTQHLFDRLRGGDSEDSWWAVGVCMLIIGDFTTIIGMSMNRISAVRNSQLRPSQRTPRFKRPLALAGYAVYACGQFIVVPALALAPIAIVGPVACATAIISSLLISFSVTGEEYWWSDKVAIALALIGSVGCIWFGPHSTISSSLQNALAFCTFWKSTGATIVVTTTVVLGTICTIIIYNRKKLEGANATGKHASLVALAFPMLASIIGAVTATFTKITGMFFTQGWIYLRQHLLSLLGISLTWITLFLVSLFVTSWSVERFDGRYYLPTYNVMSALFITVSGGVAFHEFENLPTPHIILFFFSGLVCLMSVVFGTQHTGVTPEVEDSEFYNKSSRHTRANDDLYDEIGELHRVESFGEFGRSGNSKISERPSHLSRAKSHESFDHNDIYACQTNDTDNLNSVLRQSDDIEDAGRPLLQRETLISPSATAIIGNSQPRPASSGTDYNTMQRVNVN